MKTWIGGVLLAAVAYGARGAAAEDIVEIRLRGRFFAEPATVVVTVAVVPAEDHRFLVIAADGDRLFRSSEVALEGAHAQRVHTVELKNLPSGNYVLRAEVRSAEDVRGFAEETLVVGTPDHRQ